jgi:hypothetical protein
MADTVNGALVITWRGTRPEASQEQTLGVLSSVLAHWDERQKDGRITGYRLYGSTHGSAEGLMIIEGRLADLAAMSVESQSMRLLAKAGTVVEHLSTRIFAGGSVDDATQFFLNGMAAAAEASAGA